jgi:hypothetical protein
MPLATIAGQLLLKSGSLQTDCSCCKCSTAKCPTRMVHSWLQFADGAEYSLPESIRTDASYCFCEKWQLVARTTNPQFTGYPRVTSSGSIAKTTNPDGTKTCSIDRSSFLTHLGVKGYAVSQELWVMCAASNAIL